MSNILIIKHGSLGDIAQACGAIQDISENHNNDQIYLLTTKPYFDLFKKNPNLTDVILDKRLSRFNLIYLYFLMRKIKKLKISKVYDLQNSSRTNFYKKILFPSSDVNIWSSSETTLPNDKTKEEFDKKSVLQRFSHQLQRRGRFRKNPGGNGWQRRRSHRRGRIRRQSPIDSSIIERQWYNFCVRFRYRTYPSFTFLPDDAEKLYVTLGLYVQDT
mgnify:CR=1 FL=1